MWGRLLQQLASYTKEEQELIHTAYEIAEESHKNQKRASGEAYISHPVAVALRLIELNLDAVTIAASLLHDVIEDSVITAEELKKKVGADVTFLVESLTKLDRIQYQGFERKVESTRKMFLAVAKDVRVVLIKLADRLHNMKTVCALRPEKRKRMAQETLELYAPLAYRSGIGEWKGELEDLAFPIVHPEEYAWLMEEIAKVLPKRRGHLQKIAPMLERELKKAGVTPLAIDSRVKHLYSLWKKLLRNNLDLTRITDLVALRIIVKNVEECYQTLGVIHALWKPMPGRIKDYIAMPKPNGYKSIHTTVFCLDSIVTEFQIRTKEMHEEAEFGIAAHWAYDEAGKPEHGARATEEQIRWVKKLQEWQKEFPEESSEEFMDALKINFFKDRIFVLTPKGEVIDLPEGSTPIDFAYHIHSDIGNHMAGAKVNGKMVSFSHPLVSGDSVEIIIQKNKKPSTDWLTMTHSPLARGHIRSALRKQGIESKTETREKPKEREITLNIVRENRIGLLKDITTLLSKEHLDITKTETDVHDATKPFLTMRFQIPRAYDIEKLLTRMRRIKGIKGIELKL